MSKFTLTSEDLEEIKKSATLDVQTYQAQIDTELSNVKNKANAHLFLMDDIDDETRKVTSMFVNSLDVDTIEKYKDNIGTYVYEIVNTLKDNPEVKDAMTKLFTTNFDDIPVEDAKTQIDSYIDINSKILGKDPLELKI